MWGDAIPVGIAAKLLLLILFLALWSLCARRSSERRRLVDHKQLTARSTKKDTQECR
jgi:hypothetical protein